MFLEKDTLPKPVPWDQIFENNSDLILEIGFGKGRFLRDYALEHPERNFVGIERFIKWTRHAQARLEKAQVTNVRLMCGLAQYVVADYFEDQSIREIHILFPDPWPKRRHHKHRILQKAFLELFHQKLQPHGELHITTDHQSYFEDAMKAFSTLSPDLFDVVDKHEYPFKTNYQVKYEKEGRPIYFFQAVKKPSR